MNYTYRKSTLPNGIRVITEYVPNVHSVSMGIWVALGSRDELPEDSGMAHFIEHMIFKGTSRYSALDIAKVFDQMGGISNAFTSKETTCFYVKVLDSHLDKALEILSDIFLHSRFDSMELEKERQVILQEIRMVQDSPEELIHDLFSRDFWPDNGLGRSVLGTEDTVRSVQSESLRNYVNKTYVGPKVILAAAGNVEHDAFLARVSPVFSTVSDKDGYSARSRPTPGFGARFFMRDLEQVHMLMGFNGISASDPMRYPAMLMNVMLGGSMSSRLFQEIREKRGLAYSVYSFLSAYQDAGLLGIYAAVSPDRASSVASLMLKEVDRLGGELVEPAELEAARDHVKAGILLSSENTDNRMTRLARNEMNLGRRVEVSEEIRAIEEVTAEDIRQVARLCLEKGRALTCLGPLSDLEAGRCEDIIKSVSPPVLPGESREALVAGGR